VSFHCLFLLEILTACKIESVIVPENSRTPQTIPKPTTNKSQTTSMSMRTYWMKSATRASLWRCIQLNRRNSRFVNCRRRSVGASRLRIGSHIPTVSGKCYNCRIEVWTVVLYFRRNQLIIRRNRSGTIGVRGNRCAVDMDVCRVNVRILPP